MEEKAKSSRKEKEKDFFLKRKNMQFILKS